MCVAKWREGGRISSRPRASRSNANPHLGIPRADCITGGTRIDVRYHLGYQNGVLYHLGYQNGV